MPYGHARRKRVKVQLTVGRKDFVKMNMSGCTSVGGLYKKTLMVLTTGMAKSTTSVLSQVTPRGPKAILASCNKEQIQQSFQYIQNNDISNTLTEPNEWLKYVFLRITHPRFTFFSIDLKKKKDMVI